MAALTVEALREAGPALFDNTGAELRDAGDGVACLVLHGKLNLVDHAVIEALSRSIDIVADRFDAMVVTGAGTRAFSVGADLAFFADRVAAQDWDAIDGFTAMGQRAYRALRFAPFPSVAAAFGLALGGGCELMLHCSRIVADSELAAGLPEVKVGIIPGWGGGTQLSRRVGDPARVFATIASGRVSRSAEEARAAGLLGPDDRIVTDRDRLLDEAKAQALALARAGYAPPAEAMIPVGGPAAARALVATDVLGDAPSDYDRHIAGVVAEVLTGGPDGTGSISEAAMMALEGAAILRLVREPKTEARIQAMLATGKPLRN